MDRSVDGWMDGWMDRSIDRWSKVVTNQRSSFLAQGKEQNTPDHILQIKPYKHNHGQRSCSHPLLHGHQTHFRLPFTAALQTVVPMSSLVISLGEGVEMQTNPFQEFSIDIYRGPQSAPDHEQLLEHQTAQRRCFLCAARRITGKMAPSAEHRSLPEIRGMLWDLARDSTTKLIRHCTNLCMSSLLRSHKVVLFALGKAGSRPTSSP